jgi:hypothetical protein
MVKTLERAFDEAKALPEEAQEEMGRRWLQELEALRALRADIEEGFRSLAEEGATELDLDELLKEARSRRGR